MSLPDLSPVQRRAVEHPLADALVTAGAGSGKTRVLTERFVHLTQGAGVSLRRLAALTFTEKAAAQMRERIADLFERLGAEDARADVEFAPIHTIHAWCANLLRLHAVEAGLDPAFQVLDEVEASLLQQDAASLAETRLQAEQPAVLDSLPLLGGAARPALLGLLARVRGCGVAAADLVWAVGAVDAPAAAAAVAVARDDFAAQADAVPSDGHAAFLAALEGVAEALAAAVEGDDELAPFLAGQAHGAVKACTLSRKRAYTSARKALEQCLDAWTGALLDAWGRRHLLPAVRAVLVAYETAYAELKLERSALDFTDLELRARALLRGARARGRRLDLLPVALLVDEYQDTNPLQAEILSLLREAAPQFAVGDPKQSIYRFRGADVGVILAERERVGADAVHRMNTSYRACPPLVAGINVLNRRLFADGQAGVEYEALEAGTTSAESAEPSLTFALVDAGADTPASEARALEAAWIAARIDAWVQGGLPGVRAPAGGDAGRLRYGDVAILLRARTDLALYEGALEARGIPYLTQKGTGYFQAEEIRDLVHVLRVVHNPADTFAFAAFCTGPALGAGDAELVRWFAPGAGTPWERLQAESLAGGPYAAAVDTLRALREEAVAGSLARCVEGALVDLGLLEVALWGSGGDRKAANLRKAVELARRLDRSGRRGLGDLLRHLETLRDREVREADAPVGGETDDVVRLTTVHGAKGLEYRVVFVADVGRAPPGGAPVFQHDGATAISARVRDPLEGVPRVPAGHAALAARQALAEAQESRRLLYVAMTRAEERLVLSGWCKGANKGDGRPKGFLGWGRALWDALEVPFEAGTRTLELDGARLEVALLPGAAIERPAPPASVATGVPAPREEDLATARELLAPGPRLVAPLGDTRYVVTVSELITFAASPQRYYTECVLRAGATEPAARRLAEPEDPAAGSAEPEAGRLEERRRAWDEDVDEGAPLDRAALGRAVHAVIERLGPADETVPDGLVEEVLAAEEADPVAPAMRAALQAMVARFVASDLGRRLRAALRANTGVRRELALHARIRFPRGETVGGFDALLVKGSIDLWLPGPGGVLIVDHKTNAPGGRYPTVEALGEHYAWQLRLYALAAERVLEADVAGASILALDPGWGPRAVEVPVDVGGDGLEATRRLCRAFAIAELEGRYPADWRSLLEPERPAG